MSGGTRRKPATPPRFLPLLGAAPMVTVIDDPDDIDEEYTDDEMIYIYDER